MPQILTAVEARIIGCLMEKSVLTPDQYPLTLNALTNACNQKSSRNPVMSLEKGEVQRTARILGTKHLVRTEENFKSGVDKYLQRFCNTHLSDYRFDPAQFAVVCVLLLRGPRTPGELRANSGRLHTFEDNDAVVSTLNSLMEWEGDPLVVKLPRRAGRKDAEYMHVFFGPIDLEAHASQAQAATASGSLERVSTAELAQRVSRLEEEVAELKAQLGLSQ
ncbi:MAG: YceH family protein [Gammaproteobacteria bacterium]|nr:YceH family protein [Gammaproteobacteria bacterium]